MTWVTWNRDPQTAVADNAAGTFTSRLFDDIGFQATIAVSGTHAFVTWGSNTDRIVIAERVGKGWTSTDLDGIHSRSARVVAQAGRARVVYLRVTTTSGPLLIRTQT